MSRLMHKPFLVLLAFSSALGRVAQDEALTDILTNVIKESEDVKKIKTLPDIRIPFMAKVTTTIVIPPCSSDDDSENEVDSNEKTSCSHENNVDNGTALLLTSLIDAYGVEHARNASKVNTELFLGYDSYSGFLTVDKSLNSNIFFWHFPQEKRPKDAPWILWLQGGPGASSLVGLFDEVGPFKVDSHHNLWKNPYTWLQNHSLVFFDSPVGTGYSFTEHEDGFATDLPTCATHLYAALKQFLQLFPELKSAPLFLAGESYAGKYIPALAMEIHKFKDSVDGDINLKGLILGNAFMGPEMLKHLELPYYYFGLLDKHQIKQMQPLINSFAEDIAAGNSVAAKKKWNSLIAVLLTLTNQGHAYNFLRDDLGVGRYVPFLKRSDVKRALHVGDISYAYFNVTVNTKLAPDFLSSTKNMMEQLLDHYKVLSYCGQLDQMVPCVAASENYRRWRWSGSEEFKNSSRSSYIVKNKMAGYYKSGGNLTEVVIRGAGHMVPLDAPMALLNLVSKWTHGQAVAVKRVNNHLINMLLNTTFIDNSITYYLT